MKQVGTSLKSKAAKGQSEERLLEDRHFSEHNKPFSAQMPLFQSEETAPEAFPTAVQDRFRFCQRAQQAKRAQ